MLLANFFNNLFCVLTFIALQVFKWDFVHILIKYILYVGSRFDIILLIRGCLLFMRNSSSNCSRVLQFIWYCTFGFLLRICLISCFAFPLCWLMICVLMELSLDKWHVKQRNNVVVVELIYVFVLSLENRKFEFKDNITLLTWLFSCVIGDYRVGDFYFL